MAKRPYSLTWMPEALKKAGLKVEEVPGWQWRGHGDVKNIEAILLHHTADGLTGNMPSLDTITRGRSDLRGPLANLGLGRDGTYYIVAAGKAWHAGRGHFMGISPDGNSHMIGIEAENSGYIHGPMAEKWSDIQMDAYRRGVAALLQHLNLPAKKAIGHREWAPDRKVDPTFDLVEFRKDVEGILHGNNLTKRGT